MYTAIIVQISTVEKYVELTMWLWSLLSNLGALAVPCKNSCRLISAACLGDPARSMIQSGPYAHDQEGSQYVVSDQWLDFMYTAFQQTGSGNITAVVCSLQA